MLVTKWYRSICRQLKQNTKQNRNNKDTNVFATKLTYEQLCKKTSPDLNVVPIIPYAICGKSHFKDTVCIVPNLRKVVF